MPTHRPLEGIRVIELGQLLAGPFTGLMLAYFGAEVIKVEPPKGGDPIRGWREVDTDADGVTTSYWWRSLGRNKKCITLDLKSDKGRELTHRLIDGADVVIENFRPGTMEKWGLGPEVFKQSNPGLVYTRISGYGQTGPYSHKPGFASACEAISGFRYVNGHPGEAPVRPNLSIGDTISGMHAAMGVLLAIIERQRNDGSGQVVDVALYESMFNLLEAVVPEYSGAGVVREPSGSTLTGIVPTNTYRCSDGKYVVIGGNGDSIFQRLMTTAGYPQMASDPRLADNAGRVQHEQEIDEALAAWCSKHSSQQILDLLEEARVPCGPIYNVEDMFNDPHFRDRGLFERVEINGKPLDIPAVLPRLAKTPGATQWAGSEIGSHNREVFGDLLGLSDSEINELSDKQVI
ncbi:CaiB/BaiF CoA-transferase family protein [Porticoccus sp. W117]|uniref:CaiB/BaiF CoA transferase family protein n=1 Tax=Porticoccus sp. W117 TaxID=3054777 RepID=UPI002591F871|nr:CaiB/BaiF CoA-transferase family protein [Porticoccus sp. W117]MDM3870990.1 CaiB/BaiF CoA-transferase family protein [Porticoccus sp. W117]